MYQIVNQLLQPYTFCCLLAGGACLNLWRQRLESRRRLLLVSVPVAVLTVMSTPAVAYLAQGTLQWQCMPRTELPEGTQAIVVLGGWSMPADAHRPHALLGYDSIYRCLHAAELYERSGPCPILVSGGRVEVEKNQPEVAPLMKEFLIELGVAPDDLLIEDHSTTTYENAVECRKILAPRKIERLTLVTNASHMPRAAGCFRGLGFDVTPAPCELGDARFDTSLASFLPTSLAASSMSDVAHEWLGIVWYWLHGRI